MIMNEITRIHIAKVAYDSELVAKKQLEKYIKSLEAYTQDAEVVKDIEIRITELLAERGVAAGGVITTDDVSAIRKQLGEPYEFAGDGGDIAVGGEGAPAPRRLYRSTDNAVLGGVLSGFAAFFNVNPLWIRLLFILVLFASFGLATLGYIIMWIVTPPARTAAEKLQLAGREVTVESIKDLSDGEDKGRPNRVAPLLQTILSITFGSLSALASIGVFAGTVWFAVGALTLNGSWLDQPFQSMGLTEGNMWLLWLLFWVIVFGLLLLSGLFGLIAYAFFAKKLTKKMVISGIVIVVLGISSVATVLGVSATQSLRVAQESKSMVREVKTNLPAEFANVNSVAFETKQYTRGKATFFPAYTTVRYVVSEGPARYELSALPSAKVNTKIEDGRATLTLDIPESFRNRFVQPTLTVYGPALKAIQANSGEVRYEGTSQEELTTTARSGGSLNVTGTYQRVFAKGGGMIDLGSSTVGSLVVEAEPYMTLHAGMVRDLTVTQPDVCPSGAYDGSTVVEVAGVSSGNMTLNGKTVPAETVRGACARVQIGDYHYTGDIESEHN